VNPVSTIHKSTQAIARNMMIPQPEDYVSLLYIPNSSDEASGEGAI
jgi:hypothetical protein